MLLFVDQVVGRMTPRLDDYDGPIPQLSLGVMVTVLGVPLLAAIGALAAWQVCRALDPLAAQIAELEDQIDELSEDDEPASGA